MKKQVKLSIWFALFFLSFLMHFKIFKKDLIGNHIWRQTVTQINIQNFYRHDFNILNPRNNVFNGGKDNIVRFEFPIFQWSIAGVYKIFGESILITRICMFSLGLIGVFGIFFLCKELFKDELSAFVGAFLFNFSPVFYFHTMNPLPDIFALSTGILSLGFFYKFYFNAVNQTDKNENVSIFLAALFFCLSVLSKLPYVLYGAIPFVVIVQELISKQKRMQFKQVVLIAIFYGIAIIPSILWYAFAMSSWSADSVLGGVLKNPMDIFQTIDLLSYHFFYLRPFLIIGIPSFFLFCAGIFYLVKIKKQAVFWQFLILGIILFAYFIYELPLISRDHDYYIMPLLVLFFTLSTFGFKKIFYVKRKVKPLVFIVLVLVPIYTYLKTQRFWTLRNTNFDKTIIAESKTLKTLVSNDEKCILLNDESQNILSYFVDKQGFVFSNDNLPIPWIEDMIVNHNVHFMYSTSRKVDENPELVPFIDSIIYQKETVKVIKLKLPLEKQ